VLEVGVPGLDGFLEVGECRVVVSETRFSASEVVKRDRMRGFERQLLEEKRTCFF